jgi:hypothetical protein
LTGEPDVHGGKRPVKCLKKDIGKNLAIEQNPVDGSGCDIPATLKAEIINRSCECWHRPIDFAIWVLGKLSLIQGWDRRIK